MHTYLYTAIYKLIIQQHLFFNHALNHTSKLNDTSLRKMRCNKNCTKCVATRLSCPYILVTPFIWVHVCVRGGKRWLNLIMNNIQCKTGGGFLYKRMWGASTNIYIYIYIHHNLHITLQLGFAFKKKCVHMYKKKKNLLKKINKNTNYFIFIQEIYKTNISSTQKIQHKYKGFTKHSTFF